MLTKKQLFNYSALALPLAFVGLPIYINAPDLYIVHFGLSLKTIGLSLLALRVFDAIQDPIIGKISDKLHNYRYFIIILGLLMLISGFYMLFNPVYKSVPWFAISVLVSTTGYSIANINYQALGGLWIVRTQERTTVTTCRELCGLIGVLLATTIPGYLSKSMGIEDAYLSISAILLALIIIAASALYLWKNNINLENTLNNTKTIKIFDAWNVAFFSTFFINSLAAAIPAVLVLFFVRDVLHAETEAGKFLFLYFISGAIAMPIWHKISGKIGKIKTWFYSMIIAISSFFWAFYLTPGQTNEYAIICILSGIAVGADLTLPAAIIADRLEKIAAFDCASRYFAGLNLFNKLALAGATGITLPTLANFGYTPGSTYKVEYLSYAYALIPIIFKLMAATSLSYLFKQK